MRLPAQLLQQIVGHPVAQFSGSGHKRAFGRVDVQKSATIFPVRDEIVGPSIFVSIRDVSAESIGLSSAVAMMPFSSLILSIPVSGTETVALRCRVMRCTRVFGGQFSLVAQFVSRVDPQTLQAIPVAGN
jgi:hypothetical protein